MITVEMSDDIRKYENKTVGPFTTRQAVCLTAGFVVGLIAAAIAPLPTDGRLALLLGFLTPFIICGYVKMDGSYFETIAANMLYLYVLTPAKRKNLQKSEFMEDYKEQVKKEEQIKLSKMTSAQKKQYQATHGPNKKIQYSQRPEFKVYR